MRRAGDLGNATVAQFSGATIGVGLKETAKACGMGQAVCRGAVGREAVPGRARCGDAGRLVVGGVNLQPTGCGLTATRVSTGTGVSSACILSALRTSPRMRLTIGSKNNVFGTAYHYMAFANVSWRYQSTSTVPRTAWPLDSSFSTNKRVFRI